MNNKHLALILVGLAAFLVIQGILWVRGEKDKIMLKADGLRADLATQEQVASIGKNQYYELQRNAQDLMAFLNAWEQPLRDISSRDGAEAQFITRIRNANLATISQRFEEIPVKGASAIPQALRAHVVFEDNYANLLNWLGGMEQDLPTLRISSVKLAPGTRPEDIRMEASLDQPIYSP